MSICILQDLERGTECELQSPFVILNPEHAIHESPSFTAFFDHHEACM